ncbi:MAG: hypothetical protein JW944_05900 [Deltaproteobacteria bacterium]|nr:hypothetical protein [Deltaproteobacteria bacterium]
MDAKKAIKNLALALICISTIVLIGYNLYQYRVIKLLSRGGTPEISRNYESTGNAISLEKTAVKGKNAQKPIEAGDNISSDTDIGELNYHLDAAEEELDMVHQQLADEDARKAELRKNDLERQRKYHEEPSYRNITRSVINSQYSDLFEILNLSPERQEELKDILVDNQLAASDFYMEMGSVTPSEEKRTELKARQKTLNEDSELKLKESLGNEDYEKFRRYQETWGERYNVENFVVSLNEDEKLTGPQQQMLIDAMHEEVKYISEMNNEEDRFLFPSEQYKENEIERSINEYARSQDAYIKAAQNILSSSQLEQFKEYLRKEREENELYMEMQAMRYGSSSAQDSTEEKSE